MSQVTVNTPGGSYAVIYRRGALARLGALIAGLRDATGVYVVSSPRVWKHWGRKVMRGLGARAAKEPLLFDDREASKDLRTVEQLCRKLSRAGADRRALIVAVGGGVVSDVAGFAAASYLRGVRIVHVPTTLLAQVDSAIGGKTGVNLPEGKNLVGAFYQPRLVVADPEVLDTLPVREYRSGIYEIIKYGVIGDPELFLFLEEPEMLAGLAARCPAVVDWVIPRCVAAKARIVSKDERESGVREQLNFGHTFGHAIEAASRYKKYLHGEAVGLGMIAASRVANWLKLFSMDEAIRTELLIRAVGPLPLMPGGTRKSLLKFLRTDKKMRSGKLRFVLPRAIGRVETVSGVDEAEASWILHRVVSEARR
jgi:3-dehydroquinate synthase